MDRYWIRRLHPNNNQQLLREVSSIDCWTTNKLIHTQGKPWGILSYYW